MSDIDLTEAVEAAARYQFGIDYGHLDRAWIDAHPIVRHKYLEAVLPMVTAAAPLIERAVREQVARDIEARLADVRKTSAVGRQFGLDEAARIARGRA